MLNNLIKNRNLSKAKKHGEKSAKTLLLGVIMFGLHEKRDTYHYFEFILPILKGRIGWSITDGSPTYKNGMSFDPIADSNINNLEEMIAKLIEIEIKSVYSGLPYLDESIKIACSAAKNYILSKSTNIPFEIIGERKSK